MSLQFMSYAKPVIGVDGVVWTGMAPVRTLFSILSKRLDQSLDKVVEKMVLGKVAGWLTN